MAKKKKLLTAATAVVTAAAVLLGSTFAWQSINQTALNEASDVVANPGGRVHNDFNFYDGNLDVYAENFSTEVPIYTRIRLDEYFETIVGYGTKIETLDVIAGSKDTADHQITGWHTHLFYADQDNPTDSFWNWAMGGEAGANSSTVYMPTFNMNKDSLVADVNGTYEGNVYTTANGLKTAPYFVPTIPEQPDENVRYDDFKTWTVGQEHTSFEIHDYDGDLDDEVKGMVTDLALLAQFVTNEDITLKENVTHSATTTLETKQFISMDEWQALSDEDQEGPYWVYDKDGWCYWAQAIQPGEATGLLLDGVELDGPMSDTWYYAINTVGQFITADDIGRENGTGFYDPDGGEEPSEEALELLDRIGVDVAEGEDEDEEPEITDQPLDIVVRYEDGNLAGSQPINPETGKPTEGGIQIFSIRMEEKDLYLAGLLTCDDGTVLDSGNESDGLDVTFSFLDYDSTMVYTHTSDNTDDTEYTFTISTIDDESDPYCGYKVATCEQTNERMAVLNEETGHLKMLAEKQPLNQELLVQASTTYNDVTYESNEQVLGFFNRDINIALSCAQQNDEHEVTYIPGNESVFNLSAVLWIDTVVDNIRTLSWHVEDEEGNEVTDVVTITPSDNTHSATLTVSDTATENYKVFVTYNHIEDDGRNKGPYEANMQILNHPTVATAAIYDQNGSHLGTTRFKEETTAIDLQAFFFPEYTGRVQPRSYAYTGDAADCLAKGVSYYLAPDYDRIGEDITGELTEKGVKLTQDDVDPSKVKVTIPNGFEASFLVVCELEWDQSFQLGYPVNSVDYAIDFDTDYPIISSAEHTGGINISLMTSSGPVTEGITWSVGTDNAMVVDGGLKASEEATMYEPLSLHTVTAMIDGEEVAEATFYMYDSTLHSLDSNSIVKAESGFAYCLFIPTTMSYIETPEIEGCVWLYGDGTWFVYEYKYTGNGSNADLVEIIEDVIYNGGQNDSLEYVDPCPHFNSYE